MKRKTLDFYIFILTILLIIDLGVIVEGAIPNNTLRNDWLVVTNINVTNSYSLDGKDVTDIIEYPYMAYSYLIWGDGVNFYAKNGSTGLIDYSGVNIDLVAQNAINASNNGGKIIFREIPFPGYTFTSRITIPYSLIIEGEGEGTYIRNNIADDYIFEVRASHVTIRNIYFNGNSKKGHAILVSDAREVNIEKNIFYNFKTTIDVNNTLESSNKGWIRDNYITTCDYGIRFRSPIGYWANEFIIEGNYLNDITYNGIELGGGVGVNSDIWILTNTFDNNDICINFLSNMTYYTKIYFNHLEGSTTAAINFTASPAYVHVMNNRIQSPSFNGVPGDDSYVTMNDGSETLSNRVYATDAITLDGISLEDIVLEYIQSPEIDAPVIESGSTFPSEPRPFQLFGLTTDNILYYYNTTHWVSMSTTVSGGSGGTDNGTLYFHADFDEGNLNDITVAGGMIQNMGTSTGEISTLVTANNQGYNGTGYGSNSTGEGVVSSQYIRAENVRWRYSDGVTQMVNSLTEWYFGMAFKLSDPFPVSGGTWSIIMQSHASTISDSDFHWVALIHNNGSLGIGCKIGESIPYGSQIWYSPAPVTVGEWHTLVVYVNATLNGHIDVWLDNDVEGAPDFSLDEDFRTMKDGSWFTDEPGPIIHSGMYFGKNEANAGDKWVVTDELRLASSFQRALPED